jgi:hypothetical protein
MHGSQPYFIIPVGGPVATVYTVPVGMRETRLGTDWHVNASGLGEGARYVWGSVVAGPKKSGTGERG